MINDMMSILQQLQAMALAVMAMFNANAVNPQDAAADQDDAAIVVIEEANNENVEKLDEKTNTDKKIEEEAGNNLPAELDALLDKIEASSKKIDTLKATVRYSRMQPLLGDEQIRFGTLHYQTGPPARFHVHFDSLLIGDRKDKQNRRYVFDGRWLAERLDDQKQFRKWEVVSPDQDAAAADPLALGEGPFAVPVAFEKDRVLKRFVVTKVEPNTEEDPKGDTFHLNLKPKRGHDRDIDSIDLWYDTETLLPVRALTIHNDGDEHTINLSKTKTDVKIDEDLFDTKAPSEQGERGYDEEIRPWEGAEKE